MEHARQWLLHTTLRKPSKDSGWSKIDGYFASESAPLLNPDWDPGESSFPVGGAVPRHPQASPAPQGAAAPKAEVTRTTAAPPAPTQVSIEHTKKSIKAQRVLARVLFVVGIGLLFVDTGFRLQLAFGVMALSVLWLVWLRVLRWWEHA